MATNNTNPWASSKVYTKGMLVTEGGVTYQANWWTQGNDPAQYNGGFGTGQPWTIVSTNADTSPSTTSSVTTPVSTVPVWNLSSVYTKGMQVVENGLIFQANWWTQGNDPANNNGGTGTGQPWTIIGKTDSLTAVVPNAPTSLSGAATSNNSITLQWNTATAPVNGTVTNYLIFENGTQVGSTTNTYYTLNGLAPSTSYQFAVEAVDTAGSSPLSSSITIKTLAPMVMPNAPTSLSGIATSNSSVSLQWNAATVPGNGTVTNYLIFENGAQVGSTTNTSFTLNGLSASTSYQFAVEAVDAAGASPLSAPVTIKTPTGLGVNGAYGNVAVWSPNSIYTQGMLASENNLVYQANWWTSGNDPGFNNGIKGTGQPWTVVGMLNTNPAAPDAPTALSAVATSSSTVSLNWNPATIPGSGTVSEYLILEHGKQIARSTNTFATISGLSPATSYEFSVEAVDATGISPASSIITTTTLGSGQSAHTGIFAPYIDMCLPGHTNLAAIAQASGVKTFTLAFMQSAGPGAVGWGGYGSLANDAPTGDGVSILTRIQELKAVGGNVIISFGGAAGTDPATVATSAQQLQVEYQSVINKYGVNSLDFDIEGGTVSDQSSIHLRDQALVALEAANPGLKVSFTLPVLPTGLVDSGLKVLQSAKADGLHIDVVNIMAMDYGVDSGKQMGTDAINAALSTYTQLQKLGMANTKIGITVLIGINDISNEIFTLADAQQVLSFAQGKSWISELSIWSIARDNGSAPNITYQSPTASGLSQDDYAFSHIFNLF